MTYRIQKTLINKFLDLVDKPSTNEQEISELLGTIEKLYANRTLIESDIYRQKIELITYVFSENRLIDAIELEGLESVTMYEIAKLLSPVAINFSGALGTERTGAGVNISIGIPQIFPYSYRKEYGVSYYADDFFQDKPVVETRSGTEHSFLGGLFTKKPPNL